MPTRGYAAELHDKSAFSVGPGTPLRRLLNRQFWRDCPAQLWSRGSRSCPAPDVTQAARLFTVAEKRIRWRCGPGGARRESSHPVPELGKCGFLFC
jgi:hypothetical protein